MFPFWFPQPQPVIVSHAKHVKTFDAVDGWPLCEFENLRAQNKHITRENVSMPSQQKTFRGGCGR